MYYRILAVVYVNGTNVNEKLVGEGYAEVMYILSLIRVSGKDEVIWAKEYITIT